MLHVTQILSEVVLCMTEDCRVCTRRCMPPTGTAMGLCVHLPGGHSPSPLPSHHSGTSNMPSPCKPLGYHPQASGGHHCSCSFECPPAQWFLHTCLGSGVGREPSGVKAAQTNLNPHPLHHPPQDPLPPQTLRPCASPTAPTPQTLTLNPPNPARPHPSHPHPPPSPFTLYTPTLDGWYCLLLVPLVQCIWWTACTVGG